MPLQIIRDDITKVKADAIVNTANPAPTWGAGTDSAIYQAAGAKQLLKCRSKIGEIAVGDAAVTPAFRLPARHIIHTVGPIWQDGNHGEYEALRSCYEKSLHLAKKLNCKSIAFPLISTGSYGFPRAEALRTALKAIGNFLQDEEMTVYLVVFDTKSVQISEELNLSIEKYIDEKLVVRKLRQEYASSPAEMSSFNTLPPLQDSLSAPAHPSAPAPSSALASSSVPTPSSAPVHPSAPARRAPEKRIFPAKASAPRSLEDVVGQLGETFQERLFRLVDERGLTDVEVYKRANLDRKLFSKIRCNANYKPKKKTALALAIALRLNLDETRDLLGRAELALSPSSVFDLIIEYFITNEIYDIYAINAALFQHEQPLLGA